MPTAEIALNVLPLDTPFPLEIEGVKIVVVRTSDNLYAFHDVCPHAFWPLSAGAFHNGRIECPGHAWEFDVQTGVCMDSPSYCLTPVGTAVDADVVRLEWHVDHLLPGNKRDLRALSQKPSCSADAAAAASQNSD
jgi:nitrite reductase (NADH) small subunit